VLDRSGGVVGLPSAYVLFGRRRGEACAGLEGLGSLLGRGILFTAVVGQHPQGRVDCRAAPYRIRVPVELGAVIVERGKGSGCRGRGDEGTAAHAIVGGARVAGEVGLEEVVICLAAVVVHWRLRRRRGGQREWARAGDGA